MFAEPSLSVKFDLMIFSFCNQAFKEKPERMQLAYHTFNNKIGLTSKASKSVTLCS